MLVSIVLVTLYSMNNWLYTTFVTIGIFFSFYRSRPFWIFGVMTGCTLFDIESSYGTIRAIFLFSFIGFYFAMINRSILLWKVPFFPTFPFFLIYASSFFAPYTNSLLVATMFFSLAICSAVLYNTLSTSSKPALQLHDFKLGFILVTFLNAGFAWLQVIGIFPTGLHTDILYLGRPTGFFSEPNFLAIHLLIGIILLFSLAKTIERNLVIFICMVALIFATTRSTWIALIVILPFLFYIKFREQRHLRSSVSRYSLLSAFFLLLILFASASVFLQGDNFFATRVDTIFQNQSSDASKISRYKQWDGLLRLSEAAPWYGGGLTSSGRISLKGEYVTGVNPYFINNVGSNWILSLWAEGKLLSIPLIAFFLFLIASLITNYFGLALMAVLICSLTSNTFWYSSTFALLAICLFQRHINVRKKF